MPEKPQEPVGPQKAPQKDWKVAYKQSMADKIAIATHALINIRDGAANPREIAKKALESIVAYKPQEPK